MRIKRAVASAVVLAVMLSTLMSSIAFAEINETNENKVIVVTDSESNNASDRGEAQWHNIMARSAGERDRGEIGGDGMQVSRFMTYSPKNDYQTAFMGVDTAGIYRSDDGGKSWVSKMEGVNAFFGKTIVIDPKNYDVVYAMMDAHPTLDSPTKGLYMSTNNGETWTQKQHFVLGRPPENCRIIAIFGDSYDAAIGRCKSLLVGTNKGLYITKDGCETFSKVSQDVIGEKIITSVLISADSKKVFVGTAEGMFMSADGGATFVSYDMGVPEKAFITAAAYDSVGDKLYLISNGKQVYKKEGNSQWKPLVNGLPTLIERATYYDIQVHPAAPNKLMLGIQLQGFTSPYYSEDFGESWALKNKKVMETRFSMGEGWGTPRDPNGLSPSLSFAPNPKDANSWLKAFNFGAVFKTTDSCETWVWSNENYGGARGLRLISDPNDYNHFIINGIDIGPTVTFDGGQTFEVGSPYRHEKTDALASIIMPYDDARSSIVFSGIGWHTPRRTGSLQKSTDGGKYFEDIPNTMRRQKGYIFVHPKNPSYIYASDVFSKDGGKTWQKITEEDNNIQIFATDPENEETVYLYDAAKIYKSYDCGVTHTVINELPIKTNYSGSLIAAVTVNSTYSKAYIGYENGIFIYDFAANQLTFKTYADGFVKNPDDTLTLMSIVVDPRNDNIIYAGDLNVAGGNGAGVFQSTDGGMTWQLMNQKGFLGVKKIWGLGVDGRGIVWAFTDQGHYWYGDLTAPNKTSQITAKVNSGAVKLQWAAVNDAFTYQVKRSLSPNGPFEVIKGGVDDTTYNDEDIEGGKTYYYVIAAGNIAGEGPASKVIAVPVGINDGAKTEELDESLKIKGLEVVAAKKLMTQDHLKDTNFSIDNDASTSTGFSPFKGSYIVYKLPQPTDVGTVRLLAKKNWTFGVPKDIEIYAYNDKVIYNEALNDPKPVLIKTHTIKDNEKWQNIKIDAKKATHIMLKFASLQPDSLLYGSINEVEIYKSNGKTSSETDNTGDSSADIIKDKLKDAVVLFVGLNDAYIKNTRTKIDPKNISVKPIVENGRTLVPVRFISENFGSKVDWDEASSRVTITSGNDIIKLQIGDKKYTVNGQELQLDVPAQVVEGRTLIPLRAIVEALSKKIFWDDRGLIIISNQEGIFDSNSDKYLIDNIVGMFKFGRIRG